MLYTRFIYLCGVIKKFRDYAYDKQKLHQI